jgi:hypothetical protein
MPLGIGNNLIRNGGVLNPDGLSLDLQFAADKTLTARRGPTPTFTRGSGATQVGATGLIEYAPENLIPLSGSATNGNASFFTRVVTGDLDPDGDTTAEFTSLAIGSQARLEYGGILGFSYFSVWVKAKDGSPLPAYMHLVVADGPKTTFNTSSWSTVNEFGATGSVEYGPNGWVKLRSLFPATTAFTLYKIVATDGPTYGEGIAAGKVFILGGKQVSRNPSSQHYKTTTAAFYGPRFDHNPVSRTNLKNGSQDFSNTYWSGSSATRNNNNSQSPDGTTTACLVTGAGTSYGGLVRAHAVATLASTTYTWSCFAKAGTHNFLGLAIQGAATLSGQYSHFNLSTGVATAVTSQSGTIVSASMTPFPNGWYRCVLVYTTASNQPATSLIDISITNSDGQHNYSGTGNLFIWGAQLEAGSTATSYIPTTTAPVTIRDCRGLLIEESRTNLNVRSEELGNAAYSSERLLPVISNVSVAPDGNISADRIVENTSNGVHRLFTPTFNATSGTTYTASVFAKSDGRRYLYLNAGSPFNARATFDLQNGVVSGAGAGSSAITKLNNGWYRCAVTGTATTTYSAVVSLHINNTVSAAFDDTYTGDGTSGLLLWGAQVEAGSFPTSYIPTTTGSVVRGADVCNITGSDFSGFYNQPEGTIFVDVTPQSVIQSAVAVYFNTINFQQSHVLQKNNSTASGSGNRWMAQTFIGSISSRIITPTDIASARSKLIYAYKLDDMEFVANGSVVGTDTSGSMPSPSAMRIGSEDGAFSFLNGHLSRISYYKKRLPNAKLQALTV